MATISSKTVECGDVLLVTAQPDNAFASLILALDGAPGGFSHCGVASGDGRILSARVEFGDMWRLRWPLDIDFGGLQNDPFSYFWNEEQRIHRMIVDPSEKATAAERLRKYWALPGGFSLPKIVAIAATLHALCPLNTDPSPEGRALIVRRAVALAKAWQRDGDFFCAEFVATLYEWQFRLKDLKPPATRFHVVVPQAARAYIGLAAWALTLAVSDTRKRTVHSFLNAVREHDPTFLSGDRARADEQLDRLADQLDVPRRPPRGDGSTLDDEMIVPPGLVTPRMIAARHLGAERPDLVRRLPRSQW